MREEQILSLRNKYVSECQELCGSPATMEFAETRAEDYRHLRVLDLHHLNRLNAIFRKISAGTADREAAQLFHQAFGHLVMRTVEGGLARAELVNEVFKKAGVKYEPYFQTPDPEGFFASWNQKFGNPPPIRRQDYEDSENLPRVEPFSRDRPFPFV